LTCSQISGVSPSSGLILESLRILRPLEERERPEELGRFH
jgi:hypothetical protein